MTTASEIITNEVPTKQSKTALRVVLTGPEKDSAMEKKLQEHGHEVNFIELGGNATDVNSNFTFKHMQPGITQAQQNGFDLVIGIDEAHKKISVAIKKEIEGSFILLNIHQLAALLAHYWTQIEENPGLTFLKSIHLSDMLESIISKSGNKCYSKIVGPGKLADTANNLQTEKEEVAIAGFTENQEFFHSEKSFYEIIENIVLLEQNLREEDKTMFNHLINLYTQYGFYKEKTFIVNFVTDKQKKHLLKTMEEIRNNTGILAGRFTVSRITDYRKGRSMNLLTQKRIELNEPKTNILKLESPNNMAITLTPSDTKMYFYLSIRGTLPSIEDFQDENRYMDEQMVKLMEIINSL